MFGTALCTQSTKVLLLGAGELGKEVAIECQRLGIEVIAVDRYENAPAMHIAHRSYVIDMLDASALQSIVDKEKPDYIVPEIEAIATEQLVKLEQQGINVVPNANATKLTMNREGIRRLAAEELNIPTSNYLFANHLNDFKQAIEQVKLPCVVKPIMSSSGKGQSIIRNIQDIEPAWHYAQEGGRTGQGRVIVEELVNFDYEITLLTVRAIDGIHFCAPIGHRQEGGDYRESWQPQIMSTRALERAQQIAEKVVNALGGYGLFGVELFVRGDTVIFNEVSPRPHDTGMVTMISQDQSEFALHVRAFLKLPICQVELLGPSASAVILGSGKSNNVRYTNVAQALAMPLTQIRLFSKPDINGIRRMGVALTRRQTTSQAIEDAVTASQTIELHY
ncbi:formate-dependent phosphoribosylglycinamide formyltransferase [Thaumasiovibrio sp. DFM-14]|uniref:formate-dependent phosphoribosylglycinamide formyltransferase n=1 Tax=Thaumasiovibrio sp. DFM-14 TaxID=3384792 RepID=UPI00399F8F7A